MDKLQEASICRLCMSLSNPCCNIFVEKGKYGQVIASLISDLLQMEVSESDIYPKVICYRCILKLDGFEEFKKTCINTKCSFDEGILIGRSDGDIPQEETQVNTKDGGSQDVEILEAQVNTNDEGSQEVKSLKISESEKETVDETTAKPSKDASVKQMSAILRIRLPTEINSSVTSPPRKMKKDVSHLGEDFYPLVIKQPRDVDVNDEKLSGEIISNFEDCLQAQISRYSTTLPQSLQENSSYPVPTTSNMRDYSRQKDNYCENFQNTVMSKKNLNRGIMTRSQYRSNCEDNSDVCNLSSLQSEPLKNRSNIQKNRKRDSSKISCGICGRKFLQIGSLKQHDRVKHKNRKSFPCFKCGLSFSLKRLLKEHSMTHKMFFCRDCGKPFPEECRLEQHSEKHQRPKLFSCGTCGKSFAGKNQLNLHIMTHA